MTCTFNQLKFNWNTLGQQSISKKLALLPRDKGILLSMHYEERASLYRYMSDGTGRRDFVWDLQDRPAH